MLTPFIKPKGADLTAKQRRYNYWHSLTRGIAERALGIDKGRFRWMLRGVHLRSIESYVLWFCVSCILHNMCIDAGEDPDIVDAEPSDVRYEGLAGCSEFTEAVREALRQRTQVALEQAQYGTGQHRRRRVPGSAAMTVADQLSVAAGEDDEEPDPTGEDDTRPAAEVMLDTSEGKMLRRIVFEGLGLGPDPETQVQARAASSTGGGSRDAAALAVPGPATPPAAAQPLGRKKPRLAQRRLSANSSSTTSN